METRLRREINKYDTSKIVVINMKDLETSKLATAQSTTSNVGSKHRDLEVRELLTYPPGLRGIAINTSDYICLASDVYLNDAIIAFYLEYIQNELLTEEQRSKTHIFSSFFYERLTGNEINPKRSAAPKRHAQVASWTKNVNLFEKDFIIIPINEASHWFLAIICFPNLTETSTIRRGSKLRGSKLRGSKFGDSRHEDESKDQEEAKYRGQIVKAPCILIFDSVIGASRESVITVLREYVACEHKAKYPFATQRDYNKKNMPGEHVKVPQQQNSTDCGVFLLQYVEQFFKNPIKNYRIPIKSVSKWFHNDVVTRKREEIAKLLQTLIKRGSKEEIKLPEIEFPTKDGQILEKDEEAKSMKNEKKFEKRTSQRILRKI